MNKLVAFDNQACINDIETLNKMVYDPHLKNLIKDLWSIDECVLAYYQSDELHLEVTTRYLNDKDVVKLTRHWFKRYSLIPTEDRYIRLTITY